MGGEPSKILAEPPLFHGGANVLRDPEWFRRTRVTHTLSVCSQKPPVAFELQQVRQIDVVGGWVLVSGRSMGSGRYLDGFPTIVIIYIHGSTGPPPHALHSTTPHARPHAHRPTYPA